MNRSLLVVLVLGGCTVGADMDGAPSGTGPTTTPTGDQISAVVSVDADRSARIVIASTAQLCSDAKASPPIDRKGQQFVSIDLADVADTTLSPPVAPGTYTIYDNNGGRPPKSASFVAGTFDNSCLADEDAEALGQSGSVVLVSMNGGGYAGTYDVVLNTGARLTGSFDSAPCPELAASLDVETRSCQ